MSIIDINNHIDKIKSLSTDDYTNNVITNIQKVLNKYVKLINDTESELLSEICLLLDHLNLVSTDKDEIILRLESKYKYLERKCNDLEQNNMQLENKYNDSLIRIDVLEKNMNVLLNDKKKLLIRQCCVKIEHKIIENYMNWNTRQRCKKHINNLSDFVEYLNEESLPILPFNDYMKELKIDDNIFKNMKDNGNNIAHPYVLQSDINIILNESNDVDEIYVLNLYNKMVNT